MDSSEREVFQKQTELCTLLRKSFIVSYKSSNDMCVLRYYKMTEKEYNENKLYTFSVFFGTNPSQIPQVSSNCEGFCYDIRQLLREKYITLDGRTAHVPIPVSPERWAWLGNTFRDLKKFYREPGKLEYPLLHDELMIILKNIKYQPAICSTTRGCVSINMESNVKLHKLFDVSEENRFGPTPKQPVEVKPFSFSPVVEKNVRNDLQAKAQRVLELTSNELTSINIWTNTVERALFSKENREYIAEILKSGATEEQVSGFLVEDVIKTLLKDPKSKR